MKILDVVAKDVYILVEFSLKELEMIKFLMDRATIDYNGESDREAEAVEFLHQKFFPFLEQTVKQVKENGTS